MKKKKNAAFLAAVVFWAFCFFPVAVQAAGEIDLKKNTADLSESKAASSESKEISWEEDVAEEPDFSEIEETLQEIMPGESFTFQGLYDSLKNSETPWGKEEILEYVKNMIFQEFSQHKHNLALVIILMILSAVFSSFTSVFQNSQVAELGFYSVYLLLVIVLVNDFAVMSEHIGETIGNLLDFARALFPSYCIAIAGTGMIRSATVFYQFILFLIWLIQYVLVYGLLPLANGYVLLMMVNYISKEDILKKMADLMRRMIGWTLKAMIGLVVGFNVIQGMVAPAMDSFKAAVLNRTMSAVPGVGNAAGAVTELIIGSGALIKNGIGAAGLVVILYICLSPMVKILTFAFAYRLVGACMQPVADKRLLGGISGIAEGGSLLFRMMFTSALLLLLTIAILAAATGRVG